MNNFPFFRFGYPGYYNYYSHYYNKPTENLNATSPEPEVDAQAEVDAKPNIEPEYKKVPPKYNSFANINFSNLFSPNSLEEPILEILGIKLYLDDIIIICLLFILYTEGVKDEFLFVVLILLLLS